MEIIALFTLTNQKERISDHLATLRQKGLLVKKVDEGLNTVTVQGKERVIKKIGRGLDSFIRLERRGTTHLFVTSENGCLVISSRFQEEAPRLPTSSLSITG